MTRFEGEEVHNKDNGIKVRPDGRFTFIECIQSVYRVSKASVEVQP